MAESEGLPLIQTFRAKSLLGLISAIYDDTINAYQSYILVYDGDTPVLFGYEEFLVS